MGERSLGRSGKVTAMADDLVEAWIAQDEGWSPGLWAEGPSGEDLTLAGFREVLQEPYRSMTDEQLNQLFEQVTQHMTMLEAENFGNFLRSIAPVAGSVIQTLAPIAGTAIGGPVGGAVGGIAGQLAGQALSGLGSAPPRPPVRPAGGMMQPGPLHLSTPPAAQPLSLPAAPSGLPGSSATAQLMQLVQSPDFLRLIASQLVGPPAGAGSRGQSEAFGAHMNALAVLASEAAAEAAEGWTRGGDGEADLRAENYDPASPEERASILLRNMRRGA